MRRCPAFDKHGLLAILICNTRTCTHDWRYCDSRFDARLRDARPNLEIAMKATKLAKVCHREMMRRGMSGMQLASAAGVSQATLSRWFNGKQSLNDALLAKVFTVLELVVTRRL